MKEFPFGFKTSGTCERGNVLLIILIGIALLAALSFTVGGMMRSGTIDINEEQAELYASQVLDYARDLRQGVKYLQITNGCEDTDISFEATGLTGYAHTPAAEDRCKLFDNDGAGMSYIQPDVKLNDGVDWLFSGANQIDAIGTDDLGSFSWDSLDIIAWLPYIPLSLCEALNEKLGIASPPPVDQSTADYIKYDGTYSASTEILDAGNVLQGQIAACFEGNTVFGGPTNGGYHFYQVLMAR